MQRISSSVFLVALICQLVQATIFVTSPLQSTTCHGGKACTVQWLDNGEAPLLKEIGPCHVGLYNGQQVLVQQLDPVDVGATHSFVFTPDAHAGPDSGIYYINFTSIRPVGTPSNTYSQYSTFFQLADMSGSFASPVPSDTSTRPVPSSIANGTPNKIVTTISVTPSGESSHATAASITPGSSLPTHSPSLSVTFSGFTSGSGTPTTTTSGTSASSTESIPGGSSTPHVTPTPSLTTATTSTPTVTPTPTSGGGTLTVPPPSSSGFSTSFTTSTPTFATTLANLPSPTNSGTLDGKPSRFALVVMFLLVGSSSSFF